VSSPQDPALGRGAGSWRDSAPAQARADLDELLSEATNLAREKLIKHGDFLPFGAALKREGGVKMVGTHSMVPDDEVPKSVDLTALCRSAMSRKRDHLRAAAVVSHDVEHHAIRIDLEHSEGVALSVLVPFKRKRFSHAVTTGPETTEQKPARIWA
jgi:hypothetical protein